jgi:hypothetical protein
MEEPQPQIEDNLPMEIQSQKKPDAKEVSGDSEDSIDLMLPEPTKEDIEIIKNVDSAEVNFSEKILRIQSQKFDASVLLNLIIQAREIFGWDKDKNLKGVNYTG